MVAFLHACAFLHLFKSFSKILRSSFASCIALNTVQSALCIPELLRRYLDGTPFQERRRSNAREVMSLILIVPAWAILEITDGCLLQRSSSGVLLSVGLVTLQGATVALIICSVFQIIWLLAAHLVRLLSLTSRHSFDHTGSQIVFRSGFAYASPIAVLRTREENPTSDLDKFVIGMEKVHAYTTPRISPQSNLGQLQGLRKTYGSPGVTNCPCMRTVFRGEHCRKPFWAILHATRIWKPGPPPALAPP